MVPFQVGNQNSQNNASSLAVRSPKYVSMDINKYLRKILPELSKIFVNIENTDLHGSYQFHMATGSLSKHSASCYYSL